MITQEKSGEAIPPASVELRHLAAAEAAYMLVESLMIALIEQKILAMDIMIDAVETVIETKRQFIDNNMHPAISKLAIGKLSTVLNSISAIEKVIREPAA